MVQPTPQNVRFHGLNWWTPGVSPNKGAPFDPSSFWPSFAGSLGCCLASLPFDLCSWPWKLGKPLTHKKKDSEARGGPKALQRHFPYFASIILRATAWWTTSELPEGGTIFLRLEARVDRNPFKTYLFFPSHAFAFFGRGETNRKTRSSPKSGVIQDEPATMLTQTNHPQFFCFFSDLWKGPSPKRMGATFRATLGFGLLVWGVDHAFSCRKPHQTTKKTPIQTANPNHQINLLVLVGGIRDPQPPNLQTNSREADRTDSSL